VQIIITDAHMARSRVLRVGWGHCVAVVAALLTVVVLAVPGVLLALSAGGVSGAQAALSLVAGQSGGQQDAKEQEERYVRANIDAMARKLGEAQARIMQLESLAERVGELAGVPVPDTSTPPGQGGAMLPGRPLAMSELDAALDALALLTDQRLDWLTVAESRLMDVHIRRHMVPTQNPVPGHRVSSGFGKRIDPFNGKLTPHKGLDFPAPVGTPVMAAAGGVVIAQERHPSYGNVVEIDHGNQLVTRYAHTSRAVVKLGDLVRRGQKIAEVGSTGRSTGAHLHFEVLVKGVQHDPQAFLSAGNDIKDVQDITNVAASAGKVDKAASAPARATKSKSKQAKAKSAKK